MSSAADLAVAVPPLLEEGYVATLAFELSKPDFLDSSGFPAMLHVFNQGTRVRLGSPSEIGAQVNEATGLSGVLPIES